MGGSALATRENESAVLEMFIEGFSEIPVTILVSTVNASTGVPGNAYSLCVTDSSIFCTGHWHSSQIKYRMDIPPFYL